MAKENPRQDTVWVFEQSGTRSGDPYLISSSEIPSGERGNARLAPLTVRDLKHIVGLRDRNNKDVSATVKALTLSDIYSLGRIFAAVWNMDYPDKIFSCCCCG